MVDSACYVNCSETYETDEFYRYVRIRTPQEALINPALKCQTRKGEMVSSKLSLSLSLSFSLSLILELSLPRFRKCMADCEYFNGVAEFMSHNTTAT